MEYIDLLVNQLGENNVRLNEPMSKHTTFRIGGPADVYVVVNNLEKLKYVLKIAREYEIPLFIFGNGSNLLVRDKGIRGIACKIAIKKFEYPGAILRSNRFQRRRGRFYKCWKWK